VPTRRAQSLYCAIGLAKRRNKAIAPYACCLEGTTYVTIGKDITGEFSSPLVRYNKPPVEKRARLALPRLTTNYQRDRRYEQGQDSTPVYWSIAVWIILATSLEG
jgi:hypothetical protein